MSDKSRLTLQPEIEFLRSYLEDYALNPQRIEKDHREAKEQGRKVESRR